MKCIQLPSHVHNHSGSGSVSDPRGEEALLTVVRWSPHPVSCPWWRVHRRCQSWCCWSDWHCFPDVWVHQCLNTHTHTNAHLSLTACRQLSALCMHTCAATDKHAGINKCTLRHTKNHTKVQVCLPFLETHIAEHVNMYTCMHFHNHAHTYTLTHICMHAHIHMLAWMHACMHAFTHTHTHTHTHTLTLM